MMGTFGNTYGSRRAAMRDLLVGSNGRIRKQIVVAAVDT
jgi:hypothetical protein